MRNQNTREWLRCWNTAEYLREQRSVGRMNLPAAILAKYAADHELVAGLLAASDLSAFDVRLARMLEALTAPLAALQADPVPRYYSYTGVSVLDQYIDGERLDLDMQKSLCVEGLWGLLLDVLRFESHSIACIEAWSTERFDREISLQRLKLLARQFEALRILADTLHMQCPAIEVRGPRLYPTLEGYCEEPYPLSAVVQFTCIPRTCFHDEVLFLRTIAEDELCFKAIYLAARQAGEAIDRGLFAAASLFLGQATAFASMLHESFRVLQSMPPERFADFRDATGSASAVQSFNYQRLEIALFGLSPEKISVYQRVPHLRSLLQFASREFASLRSILQSNLSKDTLFDPVIHAARCLDRHLLSWRGLHLSFALRYLPPEALGTGGTSGPSYLQKFFRHSLFSDTEPDFALIEEIFGGASRIEEIFRAQPGTRIAPAESLWARPAIL